MAVLDIYSKRKKRLAGDVPDVYTYEKIPLPLRNQLVFIVDDIVYDVYGDVVGEDVYKYICRSLSREWGTAHLIKHGEVYDRDDEVREAIRTVSETDHCLDIIEVLMQITQNYIDEPKNHVPAYRKQAFERHTEELNHRFKEHGIGYEYSNRQIIRIDSQLIHAEVVKPALSLLSEPGFDGAHDEFLAAHEHFRHKRYKEALNEALKAFESTIKVIAGIRGWTVNKGDTANKLVKLAMDKGLIPSYYECHISALTNLLSAGVPSIRNAEGGHGQGAVVKEIDPHVVAYTLHMTASAIVLFVQSYKALPEEPEKPNE
ncbi:hypothetical protein NOV18_08605 [Pseudomonas asiatica]|uniref:Abortive infection family protein n=1 Tax=Pseudomonas asiatica TaxID=2219225 RepID=A0AAJ5IJS3_9PSED|nr:hypothetical protein [Pseudomonas asiatica]UUC20525.1 hypothetical protein NOV18_08605 [Pseudomonas asiatica]